MIKYYLKIAFANLRQSKVYSLISIASLSVGMAISIFILIYVSDELSYDRYHEKADNIYRLCQKEHAYQSPQTAKLLTDNFPEIKESARILPPDFTTVQYNNQLFKEGMVAYVDASLFKIFSFKFKKGHAETALEEPVSIVISEEIAQKYFGSEEPIGKVLKIGGELDYTVTGVFENMPGNSHFRYNFLMTLTGADEVFGEELMNNAGWANFLVYFEMQDKFSKTDLEAKICELLKNPDDKDAPDDAYFIQNLKNIHLYSSQLNNDIQPQNSITYIWIFSAIGLLILLISCFNYINLLTANATTRVTEIGVRKSFGASRGQMSKQFIYESIVVLFISALIALAVVKIGLPFFNSLSGKDLSILTLLNQNIILGILGLLSVFAVLAGWYPAFVLSSLRPVKVLKATKNGGGKIQFKKIILGVQFTIVIALIACALIMLRQINFLQNKELGFDKEHVLVSEFESSFEDEDKFKTLKQALLAQSIVSSVSAATRVPSGSLSNNAGVLPEGQTEYLTIPYVHVYFDYFNTLDIKATQGRLFSSEFETDASESIILNEAAVKSLGIQGDPIGQILKCTWPRSDRTIIGVIDDINFESLYDEIKPIVFVPYIEQCWQLIVRTVSADASNTKNTITQICKEIYPEEIIDFHFLDTKLDQLYEKDETTFQLMGYFAAIAVLLACMGLLGMASYILTRRTKEIGIRKVNGATVFEIMKMLNISFVKSLAISFVIATPIAYFGMTRWLEKFAFRIELDWWVFAVAGIISLVLVIATVSWLSYVAARRDPIISLRYE